MFTRRQKVYLPFKRLFDIVISLISIVVLNPFMLIIGIIVLIDTNGFPIFRQRRIGKNNKAFLILKFRSMNKKTPRDVPTHLLQNPDQYITKFGKFIRKSSIDELPQLFNILLGQMSFIGPRPALWNQKDLIEGRSNSGIDKLRPGLSGWAQINGRDDITIEQKIELDKYYLRHFNIWFDTKIVLLSVKNALDQKDVIEGKQS